MAGIADEFDVSLKKPIDSTEHHRWWRRCKIARDVILMAVAAAFYIWLVQFFIDDRKVARISVDLASFEGLNATVVGRTRTVSPGFSLAARVENPRALVLWCSVGGRAVVSYSGVSLAWGPVLGFCAPTKGATELAVAAEGRGVGLSDDLRERFVAEWSNGTARVVAEMKLLYDGNGWSGTLAYEGVSLVRRELELPGQGVPA
ncbi:hypothetical protein BAE44_0005294 [Dichanthelium oligosanthes]|uniref:Late embryogenesis abundant protein LEA-2 subgroup domain-containing protein n=1 Tax=Dichanthelium oligosanthes TaxID=888268 RepID=A0A1E5W8I8_9POAL|nr:hypothetical protein BAE44_0005294 [Dichanthelium oligosanthes]